MIPDDAKKLIEEAFAKPDYSSDVKLKKLINDTFRKNADAFDRIRSNSGGFGLRGSVAKKRKNAIFSSMDRVRNEFGKLPLVSVEESFTEFEAFSFDTYQHVDAMCSIITGAAIWILDQLKKNSNLYKAFDLMPQNSDHIYDVDVPYAILHPSYEFELILSVAYMIATRNGGRVITDEGKRDENFDKMLAFIEQEKLDHACRVFEEKQWDIIGRAMKLCAFFDEEEENILRKIRSNVAPSPILMVQEPRMSHDEALDLADKADELRENRRWIEHRMAEHLYMSRKELVKSVGNRYGAEIFQGFEIDDPYEICMALILLLDNGSDAPWLMKSGTTLMLCAAKMLPWYPFFEDEDFNEDAEDSDPFYDEEHFNRHDWINQSAEPQKTDMYHTRFGEKNLAQIVYDLTGGVIPFNMHPFAHERKTYISNGMDEDVADKIESISELFFLNDYETRAVNLRRKWMANTETADDNEPDEPETRLNEEDDAEPEVDTAKELEKARREIKNLRKVLSEVSREASQEKSKYERELKTFRQEHRELADLRELVFNREQGEREEKKVSSIEFPYETKKRTVVFGGHDNFLKTIRQLLPEVRFIDVDNYSFNPEVIRNADVVWVQNNYISHAQYWKILNTTRQYGIQLRYFTYSSAEKCAEQLAEEDQK